jgi:hypothetical protein
MGKKKRFIYWEMIIEKAASRSVGMWEERGFRRMFSMQ